MLWARSTAAGSANGVLSSRGECRASLCDGLGADVSPSIPGCSLVAGTLTSGMVTSSPSRSARLRALGRFLVLPLLALLVLGGWAFSSPVGASPDEDYHLASIWCSAGERTSLCEETGQARTRFVPLAFTNDPCYSRDSTESAICQEDAFTDPELVLSNRGNFRGAYPPVFYSTMSILASDDVSTSVLLMRMLNATIFVGLMTALAVLLPRQHRPTALGAFLITIVPLGLFLIPSINPSSWAITGVGVAWIALLGYFDSTGRARWALAGIAALGVLMAAGARADAAIYAVLGILAVLFLRFARSRSFALGSILPVVLVAIALVIGLGAGQLASGAQGFTGEVPSSGSEPGPSVPGDSTGGPAADPGISLGLGIVNFLNVPSLWAGVLGSWSLGWFDTPLPAVVPFAGVAVFVAFAFGGLASMNARKAIVFAGAAAAVWIIPTWTLTRGGDLVGVQVQPRYILPLIVMLAGIALLSVDRRRLEFTLAQRWVVGLALLGTQALSLYVNIRRYVTGDDVRAVSLDAGREWWWAGAPPATLVWLLASVAWGAMLVLLLRRGGPLEVARLAPVQAPGIPITR